LSRPVAVRRSISLPVSRIDETASDDSNSGT
jgi:hypothetical protein